jgi:hypothetical protein
MADQDKINLSIILDLDAGHMISINKKTIVLPASKSRIIERLILSWSDFVLV